ncbi:MAG TPA: FkbM family methyltransferase [Ferruginibacter sp.]|nr:FkbM family methyltransferase [Ferruginibacter sp.]
MINPVRNFFYSFKALRQLGKKLLKHKTIRQRFYNGYIYFNALDFTFLWLNNASCEQTDKDIQDTLVALSSGKDYFIDIGSNIGIMTLAVALRNPGIHSTAYDPNSTLLRYLNKSIKKNSLGKRVVTVNAAVSNQAGTAYMDFSTGPYSGHQADKGTEVSMVDFSSILQEHRDKKTLVKMDIEGFEKNLVPILVKEKNPAHCFVIEIHPKGLNGVSDPDFVLDQLFINNYTVTDISGKMVTSRADIIDWGNVVCYYQDTQKTPS